MKMRKALAFSLMAVGLASVAGTASAAFLTPTVDGASIAAGSNGPSLAVQTASGGFGADLQLGELFVANDGTNLYVSIAGDNANGGSGIYLFIDSVSGGAANLATDPTGGYGEFNALGVAGGAVMPTGFGADFVLNLKAPGDGGSIGTWELAGNTASYRGNEGSYTGGFNAAQNNTNATAVPWAAGAVNTGAEIQIPLSAIGSPAAGTTIKLFAVAGNTSGGGANNVVYLSNQALPNSGTPGNFGRDGAGGDGVGTNFNGTGGPNITPANYTIAAAPFAGFTGSGTYTVGPGGNYATLAAFVEDMTGIIHGEGTISIAASSTSVTGTGTAFLSEVVVGDRIQVGTQLLTVASITSDTALTLTAAASATATSNGTYTINRATLPTITGNVTALITGNITEPKNISIMGDFSTHTLTIKPAPSTTPRITFTRPTDNTGISGHLVIGGGLTSGNVVSNTTDRVVIDGSNTNGGTTRDLTIYTEQNYAFVCPVNINGDNDNIEIKNTIINNNSPNTSGSSITAIRFNTANVATNTLGAPYAGTAGFADPDNWIVTNNTIQATGALGQQHGIRNSVSGSPTGAAAQGGYQITNNDIVAVIRPIFLDGGISDATISGNRIVATGRGGFETYGIYNLNARTPSAGTVTNIRNNTIIVFNDSTTGATGPTGIRILSAGATTNTYNVDNNTIYVNQRTTFGAGLEPFFKGFECTSGITLNLRHNTIQMVGAGLSPDALSANMGAIIGPSTVNAVWTVQNNTVNVAVPFTPAIRYARDTGLTSNFNNFVVSGSTVVTHGTTPANYATLAAWKAATPAQDAASVEVNHNTFLGGETLRLISAPNSSFETSNYIAALDLDIDGVSRAAAPVLYGADDSFTTNTLPSAVTASAVASIAENAAGTLLTNALGVDADSVDLPVITATANAGTVNVTRTGVNTYSVSLASPGVNFETNPTIAVTVTATDRAGATAVQVFNVPVTNVNEGPTDIVTAPLAVAVDENATTGTVVATLSTTDVDAGDTHVYSLVAGTGSTNNASFVIVGNELRTAAPLDFETLGASLSVRVQTQDLNGTGLTYAEAIAITLNNRTDEDTDGDGVNDGVEGADANNPAATTLPAAVTTDTLRLTTSAGSLAAVTAAVSPGSEPSGVVLPVGVVSFNVTGLANGATVTITLNYSSNAAVNRAYKINGTTYTEIPGATIGATSISYSITDGGALDADGVANGTIVDPIAPAVFTTSVNDWMSLND